MFNLNKADNELLMLKYKVGFDIEKKIELLKWRRLFHRRRIY
ncbi:conserved hypothetical protein [Oenococcus oeni]|nr:conserved hypothetical protein [Oenococcus oeni]